MNVILTESQYIGTVNSIFTSFQSKYIKIEQFESYQKMSFRNRCVLAGSNGLVGLSVPLEKGRDQRQLMKDVRISYSDRWQAEHQRTIESCLARSPYYEYYRDDIQRLISTRHEFLLDKNMAILEWLAGVFSYKGQISLTSTYEKQVTDPETTDLRNRILPKNYREWPAPVYPQVFEERIGFQSNICILDLLCCHGPHLSALPLQGTA